LTSVDLEITHRGLEKQPQRLKYLNFNLIETQLAKSFAYLIDIKYFTNF